MKEKKYCFQCHRSFYTWTSKMSANSPLRMQGDKCLYCTKRRLHISKDALINDCRDFLAESAEKLLSGKWKAHIAGKK